MSVLFRVIPWLILRPALVNGNPAGCVVHHHGRIKVLNLRLSAVFAGNEALPLRRIELLGPRLRLPHVDATGAQPVLADEIVLAQEPGQAEVLGCGTAEDGLRAGGIYVWESKAKAEQFYSPEWKSFVAGKYGAQPEIQYLDAPVMGDNAAVKITVD